VILATIKTHSKERILGLLGSILPSHLHMSLLVPIKTWCIFLIVSLTLTLIFKMILRELRRMSTLRTSFIETPCVGHWLATNANM
jgi:hypothetical protein